METQNNLSCGFTLIELMVVIAIAGILLVIGMPNYNTMIKNNCMTTKANTLINSLQFSRSEAVKRNQPVTLKASNSTVTSNEWGNGWTIVDNASPSPNTIRVIELGCTSTLVDGAASITSFTYKGDGFINSGGTLKICDDRTEETGRQITISITGRPSVSALTCS